MPIRDIPKSFKLEVGSTVEVLTIAALEEKRRGHKKKHKGHGESKDLKDSKDCKDGKDYDDCEEYKEYDCEEPKDCEYEDFGGVKGIFVGIVLDENEFKLKRNEEGSPDPQAYDERSRPPIDGRDGEQFLVLALTRPSHPFNAGQIVWIQLDQIVAFSIVCC